MIRFDLEPVVQGGLYFTVYLSRGVKCEFHLRHFGSKALSSYYFDFLDLVFNVTPLISRQYSDVLV